jgi:outer membrane protein OmpA-like peptidoglycan-associated protein
MTLVAAAGCADATPRHYAPPPKAVEPAVGAVGSPLTAFAGSLAAPPDLASVAAQTDAREGPAAARPGYRAAVALPPPLASTVSAATGRTRREVAEDAVGEIPSMLDRLGAAAAPFSRRGPSRTGTSSAPVSLDAGAEPPLEGVGPTRTALRVRPVAPPFSGRREQAPQLVADNAQPVTVEEHAIFPPPAAEPEMHGSPVDEPGEPIDPFAAIAAGTAPPAYAPPPVAAFVRPGRRDAEERDEPVQPARVEDTDGIRPLDDPMFVAAGEPYATVVVSTRGVEVIADTRGAEEAPYLSLPADPGAWRGQAEAAAAEAADFAAQPAQASAAQGKLIATLLFDDGAVSVGSKERDILRQVARIREQNGREVTLVGHASVGTLAADRPAHERANLKISRRRAEVVAETLADYGVPRSRIRLVAKGDTQPLYAELTPAGEAGNRRVEVYLDY